MATLKLLPSQTDPSRMLVLTEMEETVETADGIRVKTTEVGLVDGDSVTTVVDNGTRNKGVRTVGGRDRHRDNPVTDMVAVGVTKKRKRRSPMGTRSVTNLTVSRVTKKHCWTCQSFV